DGLAADPPKKVTAEAVNDLKAHFKKEREAAEKNGLTKLLAPEWFEQADKLAKEGDEALAGGRLVEALDAFHRARWAVPYPPANLPPHVARIFGDGRLRHTSSVNCVAFNKDGTRLVSGSKDGTVKVWDTATGRDLAHSTRHVEAVNTHPFYPT